MRDKIGWLAMLVVAALADMVIATAIIAGGWILISKILQAYR